MLYVFYYAYLNVQRPCVGWFRTKGSQVVPRDQLHGAVQSPYVSVFQMFFNHDLFYRIRLFCQQTLETSHGYIVDSDTSPVFQYLLFTWASQP